MITLEQLIENKKWNCMSDVQIIERFFKLNNLEEEAEKYCVDVNTKQATSSL